MTLHSAYNRISDWWAAHPLYDPAHEFQLEATFEESHCILGGLRRLHFLGADDTPSGTTTISDRPDPGSSRIEDALVRQDILAGSGSVKEATRIQAGLAAFCERVLSTQGIQGPDEALFMGYGLQRQEGRIRHSCVADQASVANAVLDVISALPDHSRRKDWLACIESWAAWVKKEFSGPEGGIGVGILSHQWNPMEAYWCATTLYTAARFRLARLTGNRDYREGAMEGLDWLSRFAFSEAIIPDFQSSPGGVLLYFSEGLAEGLQFIAETEGPDTARAHPAAAKAKEVLDWLVGNQLPTGTLPVPKLRGHRSYELGIPWLVCRLQGILGPDPRLESFNRRFLEYMVSEPGTEYYGLYVRPWAMGLAQLSLGEYLGQIASG